MVGMGRLGSAYIIIIIIDDYGRRRMPLSPHLLQLVINNKSKIHFFLN